MDDRDVEDDDNGQDNDGDSDGESIMTCYSGSPEILLNSWTFLTIALDLRIRLIPIPLFVCYETPILVDGQAVVMYQSSLHF